MDSKGAGEGKVPAHLGGHGGDSEIYSAGAHPLSLGNPATGRRIRALGRWWPMRVQRPRRSHSSPIEFVLKDRDRMVRVQRQRTKSDDEGSSLGQGLLLRRREILVIREHERGVRGETR